MRRISYLLLFATLLLSAFIYAGFSSQHALAVSAVSNIVGTHITAKVAGQLSSDGDYQLGFKDGYGDGHKDGLLACANKNTRRHSSHGGDDDYQKGYRDGYLTGFKIGAYECVKQRGH